MELNHGVTANQKRNSLGNCKKGKKKKKRNCTHKKIIKTSISMTNETLPSMITSKTNWQAAVIKTRLGRPLWLVHAQYTTHCGIGPGVCPKEGVCPERTHTHTKAAGLPHFPTRDATWHDESKDRRELSVTMNVSFYFWKGFHCVPFKQNQKHNTNTHQQTKINPYNSFFTV